MVIEEENHGVRISTHTPLARRDIELGDIIKVIDNFYSHASREARH